MKAIFLHHKVNFDWFISFVDSELFSKLLAVLAAAILGALFKFFFDNLKIRRQQQKTLKRWIEASTSYSNMARKQLELLENNINELTAYLDNGFSQLQVNNRMSLFAFDPLAASDLFPALENLGWVMSRKFDFSAAYILSEKALGNLHIAKYAYEEMIRVDGDATRNMASLTDSVMSGFTGVQNSISILMSLYINAGKDPKGHSMVKFSVDFISAIDATGTKNIGPSQMTDFIDSLIKLSKSYMTDSQSRQIIHDLAELNRRNQALHRYRLSHIQHLKQLHILIKQCSKDHEDWVSKVA